VQHVQPMQDERRHQQQQRGQQQHVRLHAATPIPSLALVQQPHHLRARGTALVRQIPTTRSPTVADEVWVVDLHTHV